MTPTADSGMCAERLNVAGPELALGLRWLIADSGFPIMLSASSASSAGSVERPKVVIYTDGGCEPNPGRGGYGVVLLHPRKRLELSGGFRWTTNNRMEILGAIAGLEALNQPCRVTLHSDSQYLVKAMTQGWVKKWQGKNWWRTKTQRPENIDLWQRLLPLTERHEVEFRWVKGHAGHSENERCDQLALEALRQPDLAPDDGYEIKPALEDARRGLGQAPSLFPSEPEPGAPAPPPPVSGSSMNSDHDARRLHRGDGFRGRKGTA